MPAGELRSDGSNFAHGRGRGVEGARDGAMAQAGLEEKLFRMNSLSKAIDIPPS